MELHFAEWAGKRGRRSGRHSHRPKDCHTQDILNYLLCSPSVRTLPQNVLEELYLRRFAQAKMQMPMTAIAAGIFTEGGMTTGYPLQRSGKVSRSR